MRGECSKRRIDSWIEPTVAAAALFALDDDVALLEATDGSGRSILAGGRRVDTAVPRVDLNLTADPAPRFVGWLSYEGAGRWLDVDRSLAFDHETQTMECYGDSDWHTAVDRVIAEFAGEPVPLPPTSATAVRSSGDPQWRHDDASYLAMIVACQEAIRRGDAYQLCLTNAATVADPHDPWTVYLRLRTSSPTHHAGFLRIGGSTLISASPERFVEVSADGVVGSSPIKGTRRRDRDPAIDDALAVELAADPKERAENVMIVDLVRNDLSRVSEVGSVRVTRLLEVERYAQVHQLVSRVEGRLREGLAGADAVESLFPAGSMTGAPKCSATAILSRLEGERRGTYSGCFGVIFGDGSVDLAMVIRSVTIEEGIATVGSGGGITASSRPDAELDEVHLKAAPLLAALRS